MVIQSDIEINKTGESTLAYASGLWLWYNFCKSLHKRWEEEESEEVFYSISFLRFLWLPDSGSSAFFF